MTAISSAFRLGSNRQSKSGPGGAGNTVIPGLTTQGVAMADRILSDAGRCTR